MSVYEDRRQALEEYEFRMGLERGRLAVTLDLLTDAMVLVGQHGVYCQSARQPGKPAMDVQLIDRSLADAKELITSVMEELKKRTVFRDLVGTGCVLFPARWWYWAPCPGTTVAVSGSVSSFE